MHFCDFKHRFVGFPFSLWYECLSKKGKETGKHEIKAPGDNLKYNGGNTHSCAPASALKSWTDDYF